MTVVASRGRAWSAIILHAILIQIITYAARPGLSYAVLETGADAAILGVVGTAFALPALALALPAGAFVDRWGERTVALAGGVLMTAAPVLALLTLGQAAGALGAALLLGVGHLLSIVSEQTAVAHRSREGGREGAFGLYTFAASIGQALGPLLLSLPGGDDAGPDLDLLFLVCAAVGLALLAVSALLPSTPQVREPGGPGMFTAGAGILRAPGVTRALIASSLALASVDVTLAFWPALSAERAVPVELVSAMLAARALTTMASRAVLPLLSRVVQRKTLLAAALVVAAVGLGVSGTPAHAAVLVAAAAVYGFAIGVCQPITMSWLTDVAPQGQRGMAMSLRLAGNRIGQSTIPAAVGALAPAAGAFGILAATAASLVVAAVVSARARGRAEQ